MRHPHPGLFTVGVGTWNEQQIPHPPKRAGSPGKAAWFGITTLRNGQTYSARRLLDADGRDAIVPGVAGFLPDAISAKIGDVVLDALAGAVEVAVVENSGAGAAEYADGRNLVSIVSERLALFSATQAEEAAAKIAVFVEAGAAGFPPSAMPIAAGRPGVARVGIPPDAVAIRRS